jgi:hypothetical protein
VWPQCVYVPDLGAEGSLIILVADGITLRRWDCATRVLTDYTASPAWDFLAPETARSATDTPSRRSASLLYHNGYLYVASHDVNGDGSTCQFWRFLIPSDGSTPTLEVLANCPVPMDLAGYGWPGTHTELCVLNDRIYAFHADMWGDNGERDWAGGVYRYDIATSSWTPMLAGSQSWVSKLIAQGVPYTSGSHEFTVTEIPRLGVFLIAATYQSFLFGAWLFKPPTA